MNRRSFFTKLGIAAATLAILPSATTYARKWSAPKWKINPAWERAEFEFYMVASAPVYGFLPRYENPIVFPRMRFTQNENGILTPVPMLTP